MPENQKIVLADGVTVVIEAQLRFVVSIAVDPGQPIVGETLRQVVLENIQDRVRSAGGFCDEDLDSMKILQIRDASDDSLIVG